ncbi:MAG: N-acetylmuramidase family protein [Pyrinomonadaceae bacterium MAG19_C2-C3]|nr:N-acetylmuramidase family protein [Pyrinomonadaceae bacterium MAG19_C2-C3]
MSQSTIDAGRIQKQFGALIEGACANSKLVPPALLAALISVECARTRSGFDANRTRFEAHVFAALKAVRDGAKRSYNNITRKDLAGATDGAIRALSLSYQSTQIMGWSVVKMLGAGVTIDDLRDENKHLRLAVKRLEVVAGKYLAKHDYASVLRIWNTGKANGKTHSPTYVARALAVFDVYVRLAPVAAFVPTEAATDAPLPVTPVATETIEAATQISTLDIAGSGVGVDIARRAFTQRAKVRAAFAALCSFLAGVSLPTKITIALILIALILAAYQYRAKWLPSAQRGLTKLNLKEVSNG